MYNHLMIMTEQNDNYIPAWDSLRRYGSTRLTTGGSPLVPFRSASESDEDVLASIARRHVSSLGIRQAVRRDSPQADLTSLRETSPKGVFYVRRAICKSQSEPARSEPAGDNLARSRLARVLIVYLVSMAALTVLIAALCFVTRLDRQRNGEFAQPSILVDGGRDSPKTEDPEAETLGPRNTVIVVDR